ncbi:pyruvate, phosphate dikinase [Aquabacter sp. L1I39]|uniref:PEP/pyruvate-binding domain-containing protein n=1 Tax=Aquabacter sp. L1I39 TaxID=2820278 RepID=UPI001ADA7AA7|nr:PEP/pyruvate-binding domain-containing protein [Aquabacter sp. L1I39]QTL02563.1 pyruvate, phosphate dikinase [Aquabacter sp. L1I39]
MRPVTIGSGSTLTPSADEIGAKAANLARMAALGLPVPPAFVLPIALCGAVIRGEPDAAQQVAQALEEGMAFLEEATGRAFGDARRPLLVSVRSGAARSMPGMLETVLDVGCTLPAVRGLVRLSGNPHLAWDCRRRFLESFGSVVLGMDAAAFADAAEGLARSEAVGEVSGLDGEALERLCAIHLHLIEDADELVPDTPHAQLEAAAAAVYQSWNSPRARTYRKLEKLEHLAGTAVTVQAMVFGNRSLTSGSGVAFSRDPSTGANRPVIDVLFEAQGEDVVSGIRNPEGEAALERRVPQAAAELRAILRDLEQHFADVQDVEFTIEDGRLFILQTRSAKRTPQAALRIAIDLVREGLVPPSEALRRLEGIDLDRLSHRTLAEAGPVVGAGTPASAGVAVGQVAFDTEAARRLVASGGTVILVRPDTNTADVEGFALASGIVTAAGGRTAHAALVARQMGKPCIVGCGNLHVDVSARRGRLGDTELVEGDLLALDGATGNLHLGSARIVETHYEAERAEVESWRVLA